MSQSDIKKILIVGMPRSGTTVIQKLIAAGLFNLPNYNEPFSVPNPGNNPLNIDPGNQPYEWARQISSGVFKLLPVSLDIIDLDVFLKITNIDHVVLIDRNNLTDCCLSLYYAELTEKYHYQKTQIVDQKNFLCPMKFVDNWLKMRQKYLLAKNLVINSGLPYNYLVYEEFMQDSVQHIAGKPLQLSALQHMINSNADLINTKISYATLCENYQTINQYLQHGLERLSNG